METMGKVLIACEESQAVTNILSSDCNGGDLISCSCLSANLSPSGKFELCDVCRLAEDGLWKMEKLV